MADKVVGHERWTSSGWAYKPVSGVWTLKYIPHTDKDQFTGLCDRNKVEIYEGDPARHYKFGDFDLKEPIIGEVVIETTRGVTIGSWPASKDIEIIGVEDAKKERQKVEKMWQERISEEQALIDRNK